MQAEPVSPTAVEATLPWKRNTGRDPVSCALIHSLPDDDDPPKGEVPSWVNNTDYTSPAVASQEMVERQQSSGSGCHASHSDPDHDVEDVSDLDLANSDLDHQCSEACTAMKPLLVCDSRQLSVASDDREPPPLPWQTSDLQPPATSSWGNANNAEVTPHWSVPEDEPRDETANDPLPPPWHSEAEVHEPTECTPLMAINDPDHVEKSLPWPPAEGEEDIENTSYRTKGSTVVTHNPSQSCPVFHTRDPSLEGEVDSTDFIPPPWRSNSNMDVSLDQHAPRPPPERDCSSVIPPPWRTNGSTTDDNNEATCSPSLSHDMDAFSIRPQLSSHSFRFSEAESRHSEHVHVHHHMIGLHHIPPPVTTPDTTEPSPLDIEEDETDVYERVSKWLMDCEQHLYEPVPCEDGEDVDLSRDLEQAMPTMPSAGAVTDTADASWADCDSTAAEIESTLWELLCTGT